MSSRYVQSSMNQGMETHFSQSVSGQVERSRMTAVCEHLTTFNAGDIVPIYCREVLPSDTFSVDLDFVLRQSTLLYPTMGTMFADIYAFFVPNRIVNQSFKTVFGENPNGSWYVAPVTLAPLVDSKYFVGSSVQIPVGSVADYYGFPTQAPILREVLEACNDLKFRGYIEIYNQYFRDENYQPPVPYSKLNIYEGFFNSASGGQFSGSFSPASYSYNDYPDNSYGAGAVLQAIYGNMGTPGGMVGSNASVGVNKGENQQESSRNVTTFNALAKPFKANKLHDYFTSVLPSPQKSAGVFIPLSGMLDVVTTGTDVSVPLDGSPYGVTLKFSCGSSAMPAAGYYALAVQSTGISASTASLTSIGGASSLSPGVLNVLTPSNLHALGEGAQLSVDDVRMAFAVQQVYEQLARSGSRYREYVKGFFGLEVDDPFSDIPEYLGHIRRELSLYQTAQTSASVEGGSPQGTLAGFGYTQAQGHLFTKTFLEHGFVHVFCVVRHKNVYSTYLAPDNFRLDMLDFYQPALANISEQPVWLRHINPFVEEAMTTVFGYQEAWADYRFEPNMVSGYMRSGVPESLSSWTYADPYDELVDGAAFASFMLSNSQSVLDGTLAVSSEVSPQIRAQFTFRVTKDRPMPTYSVPGLDIV